MDLSIVIPTHNTRDLLHACLASIAAKTRRIRHEIIVVDTMSSDGVQEMLAAEFPDVRLLQRGEPFNFAAANNMGLSQARGRYVLLLNSDTELHNDALDRMVEFMDAHPDCGIAGCKLLNSDGSLQLSCRQFPGYMTALFNRYSLLTRLFPGNSYSRSYLMTDEDHERTRTVDWVSGACLFAARRAMDEVGVLDGAIRFSTEDVDWCKRMWAHGWSVYYHPDAAVLHHIGGAARQRPYRVIAAKQQSMFRYYRKHLSKGVLAVDAAVLCGLVVRAAVLMLRQVLFGAGHRRSV